MQGEGGWNEAKLANIFGAQPVNSIANSSSTVPTYVFLSDGIAALISVGIVVGLLVASKRSRDMLLEDTRLQPTEPVLTT